MLWLLLLGALGLPQWREGAVVGVPSDHTRTVVWLGNTSTVTIPNIPLPPNQWNTIDLADGPTWGALAPHLPADTIGVFLSGILVVTNASASICNLTGQFRAANSTMTDGQYRMQAMAIPGDGDRTNVGMWVPVKDRKIEFFWTTNAVFGCSYAVSLTLDAYLRGATSTTPQKWFKVCDATGCYEGLLNGVGGERL